MEEKTPRQVVVNIILEAEIHFNLSDLYIRCQRKEIVNRDFINSVLDDLVDAGLVSYERYGGDDEWGYVSIFARKMITEKT